MTVETLGRALGIYRRTALTRSAVALLLANAIPLVGVLFFGWSLWTILVLYWLENGIIGLFNVPKIIFAQGSQAESAVALPDLPFGAALAATGSPERAASLQEAWREMQAKQAAQASTAADPAAATVSGAAPSPAAPPGADRPASARGVWSGLGRAGLAGFFAFHYGLFWFVHGIFVFTLPAFAGFDLSFGSGITPVPGSGPVPPFPGVEPGPTGNPFGEILWPSVAIAAVALFISHGASFLFNYVGRREYLHTTAGAQMARPYARVVVLHLTIIFGAVGVAFLGAPVGALVVMVVLKTLFDLGLHLREHRRATS